MMRFICREHDMGAAMNVGGPVITNYHTFDDAAKAEEWLRDEQQYRVRECIGIDLIGADHE